MRLLSLWRQACRLQHLQNRSRHGCHYRRIQTSRAISRRVITMSASTLDYWVGTFTWLRAHDIVFAAEASGHTLICGTSVGAEWWIMSDAPHADDLVISASEIPYFTQQSVTAPNEIWSLVNGENRQITHMNDALLSQIDMQPLESFTFKGANNDD